MFIFLFLVSSRLNLKKNKFSLQSSQQLQSKKIRTNYIPSTLNNDILFQNKGKILKNNIHNEEKFKENSNNSENHIINNNKENLLETSIPLPSDLQEQNETNLTPTQNSPVFTESATSLDNLPTPTETHIPSITPCASASPLPLSSTSASISTITPSASSTIPPTQSPLPTSTEIPLPTSTITKTQNQIDEDEDEERKQRYFLIALCATFFFLLIVVLTLYIYCRRKEEEQNSEYTRAILGDDNFEFSQIQTL